MIQKDNNHGETMDVEASNESLGERGIKETEGSDVRSSVEK